MTTLKTMKKAADNYQNGLLTAHEFRHKIIEALLNDYETSQPEITALSNMDKSGETTQLAIALSQMVKS